MGEVAYILCRFEEKLWRVWELIRKGGWTREEDILSRKCVEKYEEESDIWFLSEQVIYEIKRVYFFLVNS